jgi:hypothetical protein
VRGALLTLLSQPTTIKPSITASEWIAKFESLTNWDSNSFGAFVRYPTQEASEDDQVLLFRSIGEDQLIELKKLDDVLWQSLSVWYCDRVYGGGFAWEYCDVIIRRLECIYELGNFDSKSAAVITAARLGASHNRWFVMRQLTAMCAVGIDDNLAERFAIEIIACEAHRDFRKCVDEINLNTEVYHSRIQKVLVTKSL